MTNELWEADFGAYRTYAIAPTSVASENSVPLQDLLGAARRELEQRGYSSASDADLVVRVRAYTQERLRPQAATSSSFELSPDHQFWWGAGQGGDLAAETEGVLLVQLVDAYHDAVVWEAARTSRLVRTGLQDRRLANEAMAELFESYPYVAGSAAADPSAAGESAFGETKSMAAGGDAHAAFVAGAMALRGYGTAPDDAEALRWFRRSAEAGHAKARYALGWMLLKGRGAEADDEEAARWLLLAAKQGVAPAQADLSLLYLRGRGVPQDDGEAARWCQVAAQQGHVAAQLRLGRMFEQGRGVAPSKAQAYTWYRVAAGAGDADAAVQCARLEQELEEDELEQARQRARVWAASRP